MNRELPRPDGSREFLVLDGSPKGEDRPTPLGSPIVQKVAITLATMVAIATFLTGCIANGGSVFDLGVGSCFNDDVFDGGEVFSVPVVDCAAGHDNEVFAEFNLPEGPFPGAEAADAVATERCISVFESYVGTSYAVSSLAVTHLRPTMDSWENGDREVTCFLYSGDLSKLFGSQRNSGA